MANLLTRFLKLKKRSVATTTPAQQQFWWVKVKTQSPDCLYYFGPFDSRSEAKGKQTGYMEDLVKEGAKNVVPVVSRSQPAQLTICALDY